MYWSMGMGMWITYWVDFVYGPAFPTTGDLVYSWFQPHDLVGPCWRAGAADVSVVVIGVYYNWVLHCAAS